MTLGRTKSGKCIRARRRPRQCRKQPPRVEAEDAVRSKSSSSRNGELFSRRRGWSLVFPREKAVTDDSVDDEREQRADAEKTKAVKMNSWTEMMMEEKVRCRKWFDQKGCNQCSRWKYANC
ncbi:Sister chromatid cohesion protein PDS5 [Musa troglodytarum]|uniref:Sister chromatid cohesion protein PDS5 n=1 Tax=Musa troglodytarum TaxID=320322 RepID=A0A9E7JF58_9LILI|nr:Sister chromatid cohesion protein PDS5 [Musa troglodytarum]